MARKKKRPGAVKVAPYTAHCRRGPRAADGRWYWQIVYHQKKQHTAGSGWFSIQEVTAHMRTMPVEPTTSGPQSDILTVEDLLAHWIHWQRNVRKHWTQASQEGVKPSTVDNYMRAAIRIDRVAGDLRLTQVTSGTLKDVQSRLLESYASSTTYETMNCLAIAWKWGRDRGHIGAMPGVALVKPKYDRYTNRMPTPEEIESVLRIVARSSATWRPLFVELLWATGARPGAIAGIEWSDLDWKQETVTLGVKTGPRTIPLSPGTMRLLRRWRQSQIDAGKNVISGGIFGIKRSGAYQGAYKALVKACEELGIPRFTAKGFRCLASTVLIGEHRVSPIEYEALMGHSYEMGLRTYGKSASEKKRDAVLSLGRKSGTSEPSR